MNKKSPSTFKDIRLSLLIAILVASIWLLFYVYTCNGAVFESEVVSFFGAVLAISGIVAPQYQFRETLVYLKEWKSMQALIESILEHKNSLPPKIMKDLETQKSEVKKYYKYVRTELAIVPYIPLFLVVVYGISLISRDFLIVKLLSLTLMLACIIYLSIASHTSNILSTELDELKEAIQELKKADSNVKDNLVSGG